MSLLAGLLRQLIEPSSGEHGGSTDSGEGSEGGENREDGVGSDGNEPDHPPVNMFGGGHW